MGKTVFVVLSMIILTACGVKSRPLPPLSTPQIGRGEPSSSGSQAQDENKTPQKKKTIKDDFVDEADF